MINVTKKSQICGKSLQIQMSANEKMAEIYAANHMTLCVFNSVPLVGRFLDSKESSCIDTTLHQSK